MEEVARWLRRSLAMSGRADEGRRHYKMEIEALEKGIDNGESWGKSVKSSSARVLRERGEIEIRERGFELGIELVNWEGNCRNSIVNSLD